ncbi:MAG TPA: hypothetical protein VHY75_06830 [Steroidobacteraceae bacterium]|nr:hypothetical protein [Steroidobacteraceae bacterium]
MTAIVVMGAPVLANAAPQSDSASSANTSTTGNSASSSGKTHAQRMKECMAQQKATNSSSMSKSAMETVCKNQLKTHKEQKEGNDLSSGPQSDAQPK